MTRGDRIARWLAERLNPAERDAVLGDLRELGIGGLSAAAEVGELLGRRELQAWATSWRPSIAVFAIAGPSAWVVSQVAEGWANRVAIYSFLYVNNWTWGYLASPGARHDLTSTAISIVIGSCALAIWSGCIAMAVARLSRATLGSSAILGCAVVFLAAAVTQTPAERNSFNTAVFAFWIYRVGLPSLTRFGLLVAASVVGFRTARSSSSRPLQAVVSVLSIMIAARWAYPRLFWSSAGIGLFLLCIAPGVYLLADIVRRFLNSGTSVATQRERDGDST